MFTDIFRHLKIGILAKQYLDKVLSWESNNLTKLNGKSYILMMKSTTAESILYKSSSHRPNLGCIFKYIFLTKKNDLFVVVEGNLWLQHEGMKQLPQVQEEWGELWISHVSY